MRIVDLSHTIETLPEDLPSFMRVEVTYSDHTAGAVEMHNGFGVPPRLLRNEEGPAGERLSIGTHAGTHLDAPWHYNSMIQGKASPTIDELPLEWFFGPGVVVNACDKADGDAVTAAEMQSGIAAARHALRPGDIVLVHTGRDAFYHERDYMLRGCGVTPEATRWLYEQGVRVWGSTRGGGTRPLTDRRPRHSDVTNPGSSGARIRSTSRTRRSSV